MIKTARLTASFIADKTRDDGIVDNRSRGCNMFTWGVTQIVTVIGFCKVLHLHRTGQDGTRFDALMSNLKS